MDLTRAVGAVWRGTLVAAGSFGEFYFESRDPERLLTLP